MEMSTLQEIKSAIANLSPHDKALLTAELFATNAEPEDGALEAALERGLNDVEAGRVRANLFKDAALSLAGGSAGDGFVAPGM